MSEPKPLLPQAYTDEHGAQADQLAQLKVLRTEVEADIQPLVERKEALQREIAALQEQAKVLQEDLDRKEAKILARIDAHKKHHEFMMRELTEATEAFRQLRDSLRG